MTAMAVLDDFLTYPKGLDLLGAVGIKTRAESKAKCQVPVRRRAYLFTGCLMVKHGFHSIAVIRGNAGLGK